MSKSEFQACRQGADLSRFDKEPAGSILPGRRIRHGGRFRVKAASEDNEPGFHGSLAKSILIVAVLAAAAGAGYSADRLSLGSFMAMLPGSGCHIKGNISVNTGERIYHVPGQRYYDETHVSAFRGERWFCSETEARGAGWQKARA